MRINGLHLCLRLLCRLLHCGKPLSMQRDYEALTCSDEEVNTALVKRHTDRFWAVILLAQPTELKTWTLCYFIFTVSRMNCVNTPRSITGHSGLHW